MSGRAIRRWLGVVGALALLSAAPPAAPVAGGRLGSVVVTLPDGGERGVLVLFSDAGGWQAAEDDAARALAHDGVLVIGVDTPAYFANLATSRQDHLYLTTDVFLVSQQVQRGEGLDGYLMPVVAGIGQGAVLAEFVLAQAPPDTLSGAISIDPGATIALTRPLAAAPPARPGYHDDLQRDAALALPGFWSVGFTATASSAGRDRIAALRQAGMAAAVTDLPPASTPGDALTQLMRPHLGVAATAPHGLPLVELPVDRPSDLIAILLSGDGGWADIDRTIAEALQRDGVPVVGWDSLRYFWKKKTPDGLAADLAEVMSTYLQRWHAGRVLLVGYSFGADVLPFAYNRLPPALRQQVASVTLMAVEQRTNFEISVEGWLLLPPSGDASPIAPEVEQIPAHRVLCIYGIEEKHTSCPEFAEYGVTAVRTTGAHHFDGNYGAIEKLILKTAAE